MSLHTEIMSTEDIAAELTKRGQQGWRVVTMDKQGRTTLFLLERPDLAMREPGPR